MLIITPCQPLVKGPAKKKLDGRRRDGEGHKTGIRDKG
jgi:hypothetical protein